MTTTRISAIDAAFESRMGVCLAYHELATKERSQVWKNFLSNLEPSITRVSDDDIQKLAKTKLNGRQIKSAVKTAFISAAKEKVPLSLEHLRVVLDVRKAANKMITEDVY
jgi:hypothetical protein